MRNICHTLCVTLLFLSQTSLADEGYRLETTLSHDRYKSDSAYKSNDNTLGVTYYLSNVDAKTYPLQEAAFMARSSSIGVSLGKGDSESTFGNTSDNKSFSLSGSYANPNHPYIIEGEISQEKTEFNPGIYEAESKSFTIAPGYFLRDNLLIGAAFMKSETDYTGGGTSEYDATLLGAKWLHVLPSGNTYNFAAGIGRGNYDSTFTGSAHSTAVFLSSDYYFTRAFSVGASASVANSSDSDSNPTSYGLTSSWFITPSLFAKLSGVKYNLATSDSDNVNLTLGMRY